jgi:bifunctional DNA-binding transcriptional regulator/antitoxin component of YhaV-PrlF toxin-antitoxin module
MIVTLETDENGDLVLPIGDEIMNQLGWKIGDTIEWIKNEDESWSLRRKEVEKELVLVECVSTFRMRYVVEVPKGKKDWACDSVVMQEVEEMSQHHIGEDIVSHRVISEDEFFLVFDEDNDYIKAWKPEQKTRCIKRWEDETLEVAPAEEEQHSKYWYDTDRNR